MNLNPPLNRVMLPVMQKLMSLLFDRERSTDDVTVKGKTISVGELSAAYVETAEFDCLRDDGILYAKRLRQFSVPVELYNTEGTMHGFDIVLDSPIVRACVEQVFSAPAFF